MTRRKQKSCHQCRNRHLKCDGESPCTHCRRSARQCTKDDEHVFLSDSNMGIVRRRKKYSLLFDRSQTWIDVPSSVQFADPAASVSSDTDDAATVPPDLSTNYPERSCSPAVLALDSNAPSEIDFRNDPTLDELFHHGLTFEKCPVDTPERSSVAQAQPLLADCSIQWPLRNYDEALLMRHYVEELASWFDSVDGGSHFALTIPELATESPALLNAIFALSAKHLALAGKLEDSVCFRYIDACYQALIPDLHAKAYEGDHLAAVLILRLVTQMTDPTEHVQDGDIFLGVDVFMAAWKSNQASSLHAQICLNVIRLYVHVSWVTRKPIPEAEDNCCWMGAAFDNLNEPARKGCCRTTIQAARAVNFAYDDRPKTWERWLHVKSYSDSWQVLKPKYFNPVYSQNPMQGNPFPKMLFASDVYASTHQFYALARMLLLNNQPKTPPPPHLGVVPLTEAEIERETLSLTRQVIGIALSHTQSSLSFISTLAVTYGGHLFEDLASQQRAWTLLQRSQKECAGLVPLEEFGRLRRVWRWDEEEAVMYQNIL